MLVLLLSFVETRRFHQPSSTAAKRKEATVSVSPLTLKRCFAANLESYKQRRILEHAGDSNCLLAGENGSVHKRGRDCTQNEGRQQKLPLQRPGQGGAA